MKYLLWFFLVFVVAITGCKKSDSEEGSIAELKNHNMAIVPEQPTSKDEINLIIYSDCEYNKLFQNKRSVKQLPLRSNLTAR